jgi:hypothetical protein
VHGGGLALLLSALGLAGLRTGALPREMAIAALASARARSAKSCTSYPRREVPPAS